MTNKLSVTIITMNEEKNMDRCLRSISWTDEIVVIDSGSIDRTLEICRKYNCKIVQSDWFGFGKTKQLAVDSASHDWILSLDADEEITEELKIVIQDILKEPTHHGYMIKRNSFYLGKMIRYCGWHRDYPLRLFNRKFGKFNDKLVHESVKIKGKKGRIEESILHYTYPTIHSHIEKMNRYSDLGAETLLQKGKHSFIFYAVFSGSTKFLKMYFLQRGFLDGKIGFILSCNSAFGVYLKYLKLLKKRFTRETHEK